MSNLMKKVQSNTKRPVDEEMVVAVASTKLKVVQCLPNILFSSRKLVSVDLDKAL